MREGLLYAPCVSICHNQARRLRNYTKSEIDFVARVLSSRKIRDILPVREVVNRQTFCFVPRDIHRPDIHAHYREAWHLLREPDGLTFG